ncbi:hypothetical protein F4802DRAFT_575963 [Xylaria palmicola]|nr:hypothetical protein F4802DRAFT_575963 [Xylaria palmicola]
MNAFAAASWASLSAVSGLMCLRCTLFTLCTEAADLWRSNRRGLVLFLRCMSLFKGQSRFTVPPPADRITKEARQ